MKRKFTESVQIEAKNLQKSYESEGRLLIALNLSWPRFEGEARPRVLKRLNRYYETMARDFERYVSARLLPAVLKAIKKAGDAPLPFLPLSPSLRYEVTRNSDGYLSVLYEETDDTDAPVTRYADCWDLSRGDLLSLPDLFRAKTGWKPAMLTLLTQTVEARQKEGVVFAGKWKRVLKRRFREDNFTLTGDGLTVFYPQGTLTSSGIPAFPAITPKLRKLMKNPAMFQ